MNKKILIVSYFYPPQNAIAAQRPASWYKYWTRLGFDVEVLTTPKSFYSEEKQTTPNIYEVEPHKIYNKIRKFYHSSVKGVVQTNNTNEHKNGIKSKLKKWLVSRGLSTSTRMPDASDLWIGNAKEWIKAKETKWDLVVSTFGPYSTHIIASWAKENGYARKWCADYRDLWTGDTIYPGFFPLTLIEDKLEYNLLQNADFISVISEAQKTYFETKLYRPNVYIFENGFDIEEIDILEKGKSLLSKDKINITYTGSIYPGKRDPAPLFKAMKNLIEKGNKLDLICVNFYGQNVGVLHDEVKRMGLEEYVRIEGMVGREESLKIQKDSDVLLFLESTENDDQGVVSGKLFEYIYSGPYIFGVGINDKSPSGKIIVETESGMNFLNDVEKIEEALMKLLDRKLKRAEDLSKILKYSRKNIAENMISVLLG
ncbi:hypothetical protein [Bacteriovorax sp. Seq25_V]|uniref:hypothetical protein n=1 Tax=Bacteriovorax sp. Seq25_V TaxID=1201288 RepID=UPI00038A3ADE|nr:hypothetical protein [Bacteriovorax sp. Seq25_V]EQC43328.1 hypothetical protein M900_0025 [Bacteriovorax sp. Seq25_V]